MGQAKENSTRGRKRVQRKPEYIAAVRYEDGRRELFAVCNAKNCEDARQMVLNEVARVATVVVALR